AARSLAGAAGIHPVLAELKPRHGSQGLTYTRSNAGPIRVRAESPSVTRKRAFLNHAEKRPLSIQYVTETGKSFGKINRFLPTRRRSPVHRSLVAGGAPRQRLEACLPDAHQPQCPFSRCPPLFPGIRPRS